MLLLSKEQIFWLQSCLKRKLMDQHVKLQGCKSGSHFLMRRDQSFRSLVFCSVAHQRWYFPHGQWFLNSLVVAPRSVFADCSFLSTDTENWWDFLMLSVVRRHLSDRSKQVKIYQFQFAFYEMDVVLLPVFVWGLRMVAVLLFVFQGLYLRSPITDSLVSGPGTSEETFTCASYNFIFPVSKGSMWKFNFL